MEDAAFSDAFCAFIRQTLPSVEAAELLLVLAADPGRAFSPTEAAAHLGPNLPPAQALKWLQLLQARGVVAADGERYRYQPAQPEVPGFVATLRQAYNERPVTLVRLIYALRDARLRTFAEAFKLRKD